MGRRPDIKKIADIANEGTRYANLKGTAKVVNITERFDDTTHNDNPYDDAIQYLNKKIEDIVDESNLQSVASASYDTDVRTLKDASGSFASDIQGKVSLTGNETIAGIKTFSSQIAGSINGNAATAARIERAVNIGGVEFDGSSNINLPGVNTDGNQDTTGNAASATKLQTAREIGGVVFDGRANINLPGVNADGSQDTTGNAATATTATKVIVTADEASANHPLTFIDDTTPDGSAESLKASRAVTVNPNTGELVLGGLAISFAQGDGRTTFGTITFTANDASGTRRTATISLT